MLTRSALVLGLLLAGSSGAARADDASRLKLAREIVVVTHTVDNTRKLMPTFMGQMRDMLVKMDPTHTKDIDTILQRSGQKLDDQLSSFADLAAEVYAREFSEEDLQAVLAFDRSPAGQHLIDKQPEITQAMAKVGQQWGQMVAQQVIADYQKEKAAEVPTPKL
ncbi:DUF2059 domain-containing protein [Lichenibacterium dinghuense]|uniref:DUF2059 domain-containing protein n=1 Tax=Lichenibacterium dinghuense TaxID=2895977 RepID=UPI001F366C57|nr:DUF2059 domain-containing protein [Lichenibacterium sp. 6Y81]